MPTKCNGGGNIKMSRKDAMLALGNLNFNLDGQMSKQDLIIT